MSDEMDTAKKDGEVDPKIIESLMASTMDDLVGKFVKLRDKLKEVDDAHKKKTAGGRNLLQAMNAIITGKLQELGVESCRTAAGTAYQSVKKSATTADGEAFLDFLRAEDAWDLADVKPNAPSVKAFIDEHGAPPPGVNYSEAIVAGVRRS